MVTPRKEDILKKAEARAMEENVRMGLPAITPEEEELKETGQFEEARRDLMRVDQEAISQQTRYLQDMASEMRLRVIPLRELYTLKRETGYEWTNGWTKHKHGKPTVKKSTPQVTIKKPRVKPSTVPIMGKPKRRKRHVARNGKVPRKLKGFVFPDNVWKVRNYQSKRRKR